MGRSAEHGIDGIDLRAAGAAGEEAEIANYLVVVDAPRSLGSMTELVLARSDAAGNWTIHGQGLEPRRLAEPDGGGKPLILKVCE